MNADLVFGLEGPNMKDLSYVSPTNPLERSQMTNRSNMVLQKLQ